MPKIRIDYLILDGGTQTRAGYDQRVINDYAEDIKKGDIFPPVTVYFDGSFYWLADGFHRVSAYIALNIEEIDANILQGTVRDAILYSVKSNSEHGLRRTNADKRRAVERLLMDEEWSKWSNNAIAKQCRVGDHLVADIRKGLEVTSFSRSEKVYITKHGTQTTMNTANIGNKELTGEELLKKIKESPDNIQLALLEYFQDAIDKKESIKNKELQEKINNLQINYNELQKSLRSLNDQKNELTNTINDYKMKYNNSQKQLKYNIEIQELEKQLEDVEITYKQKQVELNKFIIANTQNFNDSQQYQEVLKAINKANEFIKNDLFKIPTLHLTDVSRKALAPQLKPIVETVENWAYMIKVKILGMNEEIR